MGYTLLARGNAGHDVGTLKRIYPARPDMEVMLDTASGFL